jgi:DNA invertase Pin-like site-specific DNA recombinase
MSIQQLNQNSNKPLRALLWLAVSTPEQAKDEKQSLTAQNDDCKAACEAHGWTVVDVLLIPGFSRRFLDLYEFARAAAADGHDDGWKLIRHLEAGDFDVFVCRDGDRFGRSQALFSRIAEDILFEQDKWICATHGG